MEKLNSSDLMTGNYIQKDGIIHQVTSIVDNQNKKNHKASDIIKTDKTSEYVFLNHFEPILITKDNIKKLGFHKLITSYSIDEGEYNLDIITNGLVKVRIHGQEITEIKYIHELQNNFYWNTRKKLIFNKKNNLKN